MSEFSESYHLRTNNQDEASQLLIRSGMGGYMFPVQRGWVTMVTCENNFTPEEALIQANQGILLYYVYGEDHGWYFSIYRNSEMVCHYECWWEDEIAVNEEEFDRKVVEALVAQNSGATLDPDTLDAILHPHDLDIMNPPAYRFAELLGLTYYKWLSYHYVELSFDREEHLFDEAVSVA